MSKVLLDGVAAGGCRTANRAFARRSVLNVTPEAPQGP